MAQQYVKLIGDCGEEWANHIVPSMSYFYRSHPGPCRPCARGGHGEEALAGVGVFKALMERAAKAKINICRADENSLSFQAGCLEEFGCSSFPAVFCSGCPLSLARFPHSLCLLWSSLSYRLKTEGIIRRWITCEWEFSIHHLVAHLLHTLSCDLFYCTSLVPLCMWVSVCVSL